MANRVFVTDHFVERCYQRGISPRQVALALKHGRVFHRTGVRFHFLGRKDIPSDLIRDRNIARSEGVTVVAKNRTLITAYKDADASWKIRRKNKVSWFRTTHRSRF